MILMLSLAVLPLQGAAQVQNSTAAGVTIKAVIPENQVDKSKTYYDLRLAAGEKQTVQLLVRNSGEEEIVAHIDIISASTGRNGLIQYTVEAERDSSLDIPVTEIARVVTPQITLPAGAESAVDIELNMTDSNFDGCILGGVVVTAEPKNASTATQSTESLQITNNYVYAVGLKLTQNDTDVAPELHLNSITPSLVNYRPTVAVQLQNSEAVIIKGMQLHAQVYRQGESEVIKSLNMQNVDMAPNSHFSAGIDWKDMPLEAGTYRLVMRAEHEGKHWDWDQEFTIGTNTAGSVNSNALYLPRQNNNLWLYIIIAVLALVVVAMLAFLLGRRGRKEKVACQENHI